MTDRLQLEVMAKECRNSQAKDPADKRWRWDPRQLVAQIQELSENGPFRFGNFRAVLGEDWWCWALPTRPRFALDPR